MNMSTCWGGEGNSRRANHPHLLPFTLYEHPLWIITGEITGLFLYIIRIFQLVIDCYYKKSSRSRRICDNFPLGTQLREIIIPGLLELQELHRLGIDARGIPPQRMSSIICSLLFCVNRSNFRTICSIWSLRRGLVFSPFTHVVTRKRHSISVHSSSIIDVRIYETHSFRTANALWPS